MLLNQVSAGYAWMTKAYLYVIPPVRPQLTYHCWNYEACWFRKRPIPAGEEKNVFVK